MFLLLTLLSLLPTTAGAPQENAQEEAGWLQWGGAHRSFQFEAIIADEWPAAGPPELWSRALGDGYSTIIVDGNSLYTLYRKDLTEHKEYIISLSAESGETQWEHALESPLRESPDPSGWAGYGPNSTPLIHGERLYAIGSRAELLCMNKLTGEVLWEHDLHAEFHAGENRLDIVGFNPSPLVYGKTLIIAAGCDQRRAHNTDKELAGQALLAFDLTDGQLAWSSLRFSQRGASPILIHSLGRDQLVLSTAEGLLGIDPTNGEQLWSFDTMGGEVTPVWNGDDLLFYSSGGNRARGLAVRLEDEGDSIVATHVWGPSRELDIWQPTPVYDDGVIYGSTDSDLVCVDLESGDTLWRQSGFPVASCLRGDQKLILLDQDGWLSLATANQSEFELHSRFQVFERYSFSAPSMVGTTLFLRDRKEIKALDLGPQ